MRRLVRAGIVLSVVVAAPGIAAQSGRPRFELGGQLGAVASSQFDDTDVGVGGRVSWHPVAPLGLEAELDVYPANFAGLVPFSKARTEGLFGATFGPTFNRLRAFARLRPGFLRIQEAPEPFACLAIFPPPLPCTLGAGRTLFALDIGGGLEVYTTSRTFVRIDVGDRVLRYPGPSFDATRTVREGSFFSHDFRFAAGGGLRF